jgi:uncharacterized protein YjbJ (UPF0337 family)
MNRNRIEEAKKEIKGPTKEPIGKLIGPAGTVVAGHAEKKVGKFQKDAGSTRDDEKKHDH